MTKRVAIRQPSFIEFQTECGVGDTFDPSITLRAGCPYTPVWSMGNGDTATGTSVSYTGFADAGPHTIRLTLPQINYWLTGINVHTDKIVGDFFSALAPCLSLTNITTGENTNIGGDLASLVGLTELTTLNLGEHQAQQIGDIALLANFPKLTYVYKTNGFSGQLSGLAGMTQLTHVDLHSNTANGGVTGGLADIATLVNLTALWLHTTYVVGDLADLAPMTLLNTLSLGDTYGDGQITGALADLAAFPLLEKLYLRSNVGIVGDGIPAICTKLWHIWMPSMGWSQPEVDAILASIYANRASFAHAVYGHDLTLTGNATPSGAYQDATPPTTGLEYIYKLANDPDDEGFKKWVVYYS